MLIKAFFWVAVVVATIAGVSNIAQHVIGHVQAMNRYRVAIGEIASPQALADHKTSSRIDALVDDMGKEAVAISRPPLPATGGKWIPIGCYETGCANRSDRQSGGGQ